jgi:hypothetical protein
MLFLLEGELGKQLRDPEAISVYSHALLGHFFGCHATTINAMPPRPV